MKNVLIFLAIITLVICQFPEFKQIKKRNFKNELVQCILKNDKISANLKLQIEKNTQVSLREIFRTFISKSNSNDGEIIKSCRKEYLQKLAEKSKGKFRKILKSPLIHKKGINK